MAQVLSYEMAHVGTGRSATQVPKVPAPLVSALRSAIRNVVQRCERSRQRRALADLDDRLLKDIGISREAAAAEAAQAFWR